MGSCTVLSSHVMVEGVRRVSVTYLLKGKMERLMVRRQKRRLSSSRGKENLLVQRQKGRLLIRQKGRVCCSNGKGKCFGEHLTLSAYRFKCRRGKFRLEF